MNPPTKSIFSLSTALWRGWRLRCPSCGIGKLYQSWGIVNEKCSSCGQVLRHFEDNTWFFMYVSTAGITGIFVIGMFLFVPRSLVYGRVLVMVAAAIAFLSTHARRKGFAIAFEAWMDRKVEHPKS